MSSPIPSSDHSPFPKDFHPEIVTSDALPNVLKSKYASLVHSNQENVSTMNKLAIYVDAKGFYKDSYESFETHEVTPFISGNFLYGKNEIGNVKKLDEVFKEVWSAIRKAYPEFQGDEICDHIDINIRIEKIHTMFIKQKKGEQDRPKDDLLAENRLSLRINFC